MQGFETSALSAQAVERGARAAARVARVGLVALAAAACVLAGCGQDVGGVGPGDSVGPGADGAPQDMAGEDMQEGADVGEDQDMPGPADMGGDGAGCAPRTECGPGVCGEVSDGCGGTLECGVPLTCEDVGPASACGPIDDGCGGTITCRVPLTCEDVAPGTCGEVGDGCGGTITCERPLTCEDVAPGTCAPVDDGCGGMITCGVPLTCADYPPGQCAPVDDGCGGTLECAALLGGFGPGAIELPSPFGPQRVTLDEGCYALDSEARITGGVLELKPGVIVRAAPGSSLDVRAEGRLEALGSAAKPIVFEPVARGRGSWKGIRLGAPLGGPQAPHLLRHVKILGGGGSPWAPSSPPVATQDACLMIDGEAAQADLEDLELGLCTGHGLFVRSPGASVEAERVSVIDSDRAGRAAPNAAGLFGAAGSWSAGPAVDSPALALGLTQRAGGAFDPDAVTEARTWGALGIDYLLESVVSVDGAALSIGPGASLASSPLGGIRVSGPGSSLDVAGTAASPVAMGPADPARGWRGLLFDGAPGPHSIEHAELAGAGSLKWVSNYPGGAAVTVVSSRVLFASASISSSAGYGVLHWAAAETNASCPGAVAYSMNAWDLYQVMLSTTTFGCAP